MSSSNEIDIETNDEVPRHSATLMTALESTSLVQSLLERLAKITSEVSACISDAKALKSVVKVRSRKAGGSDPVDADECAYLREAASNSVVKIGEKLETFVANHTAYTSTNHAMPRKEITRAIHGYIKAKELVNPAAKKDIVLDATLGELFSLPAGSVVTYFKLQSLLCPLLDRSDAAAAENKVARATLLRAARDTYRAQASTVIPADAEIAAAPAAEPPKKKARKSTKKAAE